VFGTAGAEWHVVRDARRRLDDGKVDALESSERPLLATRPVMVASGLSGSSGRAGRMIRYRRGSPDTARCICLMMSPREPSSRSSSCQSGVRVHAVGRTGSAKRSVRTNARKGVACRAGQGYGGIGERRGRRKPVCCRDVSADGNGHGARTMAHHSPDGREQAERRQAARCDWAGSEQLRPKIARTARGQPISAR
jgi:hypothetical protein